ncbi:rolling circle replication-associated protein [Vibrio ostreae]|uniref:rolling circle replication-associated protein n=1 Tax=Vibrio ostreae TaxID=2841925 RepID=UPI00211545AA|nr:hypothetical protein [Vibrio ostreae]
MNQSDLLYIGGVVMPLDRIVKNSASYNAGFLGSKIYTDQEQALLDSGLVKNVPLYDRVLNRKSKRELDVLERTEKYRALNSRSQHDREAASRRDEGLRLVKGRKSPTEDYRERRERQNRKLMALGKSLRPESEISGPDAHWNHDLLYESTERSKPVVLNQNGRLAQGETGKTPISMYLMHRSWNQTFKFQAITETPSSSAPEANTGERYTDRLKPRAVSRIFEAGAYTAACHGGFTTFLTLTFTKAQRLALFGGMLDAEECRTMGANHPIVYKRNMVTTRAKRGEKKVWDPVTEIGGEYWTIPSKDTPKVKVMNRDGVIAGPYCDIKNKPEQAFTMEKTLETTIGKELSRFLDGAKKMYQRGWVAEHTVRTDPESGARYCDLQKCKVPMHAQPSDQGPTNLPADFHYIWVAECPANEFGEPNPHVHVLLRWNVPKHLFSAWSARLEKIWGHGFAKLERIRKPKAAGSYIIKAVGYAAKGANADQGLIRGNRYNIAKCSRAPDWEVLTSFDADNMTAIIRELGHKLDMWKKPIQRQIRKLSAAKAQTIKAKSIAKQKCAPEEHQNKLYQRIIRLEKQAEKLNQTLKSRGVHVSAYNRFCITFEGEQAKKKVDSFMLWAAGARGWPMTCRDIDMSDIKHEADSRYEDNFSAFLDNRCYWKAVAGDYSAREEPTEGEIAYWKSMEEQYALDVGYSMRMWNDQLWTQHVCKA